MLIEASQERKAAGADGLAGAGFTLLEIVVALAILGLSAALALQIFSAGLKNIRRMDLAHQAMSHAENVMNEILSDEKIRTPVAVSGDLDQEFSYSARVEYWEEPEQSLELELPAPPVYLLAVTVDIHFKNDPRGKMYRTLCLKTVPTEESRRQTTSDVIRQLFGRRDGQ